MTEVTYRDYLNLPGGGAKVNENPRHACNRNVMEKLGISAFTAGAFLVCDFVPETDTSAEGHNYVYYGGTLPGGIVLSLPDEKVRATHWVRLDDLPARTNPHQVRRIRAALVVMADPLNAARDLIRGWDAVEYADKLVPVD